MFRELYLEVYTVPFESPLVEIVGRDVDSFRANVPVMTIKPCQHTTVYSCHMVKALYSLTNKLNTEPREIIGRS